MGRPAFPDAFAAIMAGGSGTRFWPLSRRGRPKQFLPLTGKTSLLSLTFRRLQPLFPPGQILVLGNRALVPLIQEDLSWINPNQVISEPSPRNTAPCLALALVALRRRGLAPALLCLLPSDHAIPDEQRFRDQLSAALAFAATHQRATILGIKPTGPATGYGYIERGRLLSHSHAGPLLYEVAAFHEKPNHDKALSYLQHGGYSWNAGMFVFPVPVIEEAIRQHLPKTAAAMDRLARVPEERWEADLEQIFPEMEATSIDYGLMEKMSTLAVLEADFAWNDLGNFTTLPEVCPRDEKDNVRQGEVLALDCARSVLVSADGRLVAALGVSDLVVVSTEDSVLVVPRERAEEVKRLVEELKKQGQDKFL